MVNLLIIKELCKQKKITLKALAMRVGITEQGLHKMIKENTMSTDTLDRIANELGVEPSIFFEHRTTVTTEDSKAPSSIILSNLNDVKDIINGNDNNVNNSEVLLKALDEIGKHRELINESHNNLTQVVKALVKVIDKK